MDGVIEKNEPKETDGLLGGRQRPSQNRQYPRYSGESGENQGIRRSMSVEEQEVDDRLGFIRKVYAILSM